MGDFSFFFFEKKNLDWYFLNYNSRKKEKILINIYSKKGNMQVTFHLSPMIFYNLLWRGKAGGTLSVKFYK